MDDDKLYSIKESTLKDIADAIREKTGGEDPIGPLDMDEKIRSIEGGGPADIYEALEQLEDKHHLYYYDGNMWIEQYHSPLNEVWDISPRSSEYYPFYCDWDDELQQFIASDDIVKLWSSGRYGEMYNNVTVSFGSEDLRSYTDANGIYVSDLYTTEDIKNTWNINDVYTEEDAKDAWGLVSAEDSYWIYDGDSDHYYRITDVYNIDDTEIELFADNLYSLSNNAFSPKTSILVDTSTIISALESIGYTVTKNE